jgi:cysteine synthase A
MEMNRHQPVRQHQPQPRLPPAKQQQQLHSSGTIQKKPSHEIFTNTISSSESCPNHQSPYHLYDTILQQVYDQSITGGIVIEGTSGSTGISLAHIAIAKGYGCIVVVPDDQASNEKQQLLRAIGGGTYLHIVPPASISSPHHYVNIAKAITQRAVQLGIPAVFIDQFNNLSNTAIHYNTTGPEIWQQCQPQAFVMSAGTGGTISGVAKYLKEQDPHCRIVLADPIGSVLFAKIEYGVAYTSQQQERTLLRHRYDSIVEGIGLDRITENINVGLPYIDSAITIPDQEIVNMAHYILREEGLMIGSSTAINIIAAIMTATQHLPLHSRVCTMFCDSGQRHITRLWNREYIVSRQLSWPQDNIQQHIPECLRDFYD